MKSISTRCGKGNCPYYSSSNKESNCKIFTNRNQCSISLSARKKNKTKSQKLALERGY